MTRQWRKRGNGDVQVEINSWWQEGGTHFQKQFITIVHAGSVVKWKTVARGGIRKPFLTLNPSRKKKRITAPFTFSYRYNRFLFCMCVGDLLFRGFFFFKKEERQEVCKLADGGGGNGASWQDTMPPCCAPTAGISNGIFTMFLGFISEIWQLFRDSLGFLEILSWISVESFENLAESLRINKESRESLPIP